MKRIRQILVALFALLIATSASATNSYYSHSSGVPSTGAQANSSTMRAEFDAVASGFNLLPTLSGNANLPIFVDGTGSLLQAISAASARTNLGITATGADTTYLFRANNLSDLGNAATARSNLGVLAISNNLSDVGSAATARTNLGLGTLATFNSPLPIANGGTGATTASGAISNLQIFPSGIIMQYGGSSAPTGWVLCDGSTYDGTVGTYTSLWNAIGNTYGGTAQNNFKVPDLRGRVPVGSGTGTTTEAVTASSANGFTVAANNTKWITGMPVVLSNLSGFTTTATAGPTYYIVRISSTNVRLATTLALAQNGSPDITISGSGTATVTYTLTARTLGEVGGEEAHAMSSTELLSHYHLTGADIAGGTFGATPNSSNTTPQRTASSGGNTAMNVMQPIVVVNYIIKL